MIARVGLVALVLFTLAVLQTALFPYLTLAGFRPDLLLLGTVGFALRDGPLTGMRVGLVAGLITDLLTTQAPVGVGVLVFVALGYVVGLARPYLAAESITAPLLIALTVGVVGTATYGTMTRLLGDERFTMGLMVQASLLVGFYNALLAPLVLGGIRRLTARFPGGRDPMAV